jgi:hypothetical protein
MIPTALRQSCAGKFDLFSIPVKSIYHSSDLVLHCEKLVQQGVSRVYPITPSIMELRSIGPISLRL